MDEKPWLVLVLNKRPPFGGRLYLVSNVSAINKKQKQMIHLTG